MNRASLDRECYRMGSIVRIEFRKNAADVSLDGLFRDVELVRDPFVRSAVSDHFQDLNLSGGSYMLDAQVVHYHRQQETVSGPVLLVQIADEDFTQVGPTYLRARGRLALPESNAA